MAAPLVVSTSPLNGAVDADPAKVTVIYTFDTALLPSSVTEATFLLFNDDTADVVRGTSHLSADHKTLTFIPGKGLIEENLYQAIAVGSSDNLAGGNLKAADGTDLVDSYSITFRTSVDQFSRIGEVTSPDDAERFGPIREDTASAVALGHIDVIATDPRGFESNVDRTLSEIAVTFDEDVQATGSYDALDIQLQNVLGLDEYYGEYDGTGHFLLDWLAQTDTVRRAYFDSQPSGTIQFDGDELKWVKASGSPDFHFNTEVICRVRADSVVDGTGQMLTEDVYFTFTTEYWPLYVGVEYIRLQLGRAISSMYDDTIRRHIHAASIDAVEQSLGCFNMEYPYPAVRRYVRALTILNILDELGLLATLKAGQRKQLGDFTVQYNAADLAKLMSAYKRAQKDHDNTLYELRYYRGQRSPAFVVRGEASVSERGDFRMRTWQGLRGRSAPEANTTELRRLKSVLSTDHPTIQLIGYQADADDISGNYVYPWW